MKKLVLLFVLSLVLLAATSTPVAITAPVIYVETFDPPNVIAGTTDETAAIVAALAKANSSYGTVQLQNRQYYHASSFTVPSLVKLGGSTYPHYSSSGGILGEANDLPLLISGSGATITVSGELSNIAQVRQGVNLNPANLQAEITNVAAFSGTGVTVSESGIVRNTMIFGNATAISVLNHANFYIDNVRGDNLAGLVVNGMHNFSFANNINWQPFLVGQSTAGVFNVAGVANNGSGLIRITTSSAHNYITGNTVTLYQVGFLAANGTWTITVIDTTHFDLQNSIFAPSISATTTLGSNIIVVSSTANLAVGQTFTGTNITGTQTITNVSIPLSEITIASGSNITGTGATTLTVSNPSYTSGGSSTVSNTKRPGPCLSVQNSEAFESVNYTCHGYDNPAISLGTQAGWTKITNLALESDIAGDPSSIAIQINGAYGSDIDASYISGFWQNINVTSSSSKANHFRIHELYTTSTSTYGPSSVQLNSGLTMMDGTSCSSNADRFYVALNATLQLNNFLCSSGLWDFGSNFVNVSMSNTIFSDFIGNTLRGPSVSLLVPNSAGTAYINQLTANNNGLQLGPGMTVLAATTACNSTTKNNLIAVIDALNPTNGSAAVQGGNAFALTWCNGTSPIVVVH